MSIRVTCSCGKQFGAAEKYAGKQVKCPACSQPVVIPVANTQAGAKVPSAGNAKASLPAKMAVKCVCGHVVSVKAGLAGKTVKCPGCEQPLKIPPAQQKSRRTVRTTPANRTDMPSGSTPGSSSSSMEELFDEMGIRPIPGAGESGPASARRCPECKAGMAAEAIVCIQCGYNERLGRKMTTVRPMTQEDRRKKAAK